MCQAKNKLVKIIPFYPVATKVGASGEVENGVTYCKVM
jgi:hypothetical protein